MVVFIFLVFVEDFYIYVHELHWLVSFRELSSPVEALMSPTVFSLFLSL